MTIKFIDQVLNIAISTLIYGSEIWFAYAFSLYVATHELKTPKKVVAKSVEQLSGAAATDFSEIVREKETEPRVVIKSKAAPKTKSPTLSPAAAPVASSRSATQQIACEPVNWKKWKVDDLRKASIARACGVKSTPVGSRRKLTKADLIAQYEQNLKRMTKRSPARSRSKEKIA